ASMTDIVDPALEAYATERTTAPPLFLEELADDLRATLGSSGMMVGRLEGPCALFFIDADKAAYPDYFEAVLPNLAPRVLIAADNTLWSGRILDSTDTTEDTVALRLFNDALAVDPRVIVVQTTVRDGVTIIRRAA